jgi:NAD(P)-dependent dehydrogenase (short-subunit alcohol dehydrogenase family)
VSDTVLDALARALTLDEAERSHGIDGVTAVQADLGAPDGPEKLVRAAVEGHGRVDVLVNNVGGVRLRTEGFLAIDDAEFEWALRMNF